MSEDPYRYFRIEAGELVADLGRGVLDLERGAPSRELAARLLRHAHTLKGAARVMRQAAIAEHAHAIEEALSPLRAGAAPGGRVDGDAVLRRLDAITDLVAALGAPVAATGAPAPAAGAVPEHAAPPRVAEGPEDGSRTVRVDVEQLDELVRGLAEAGARLRALQRSTEPLKEALRVAERIARRASGGAGGARPPRAADATADAEELRAILRTLERDLERGTDQLEVEVGDARGAADRLRLVPAAQLSGPLARAARDVARALGKEVSFALTGGDLRLDGHVIDVVAPALAQLVRNAVAHGIEPAARRRRAGKPDAGRVGVDVTRRGSQVAFTCHDDGIGIDVDAVRALAADRGLLGDGGQPAAGAADAEVVRLLLRGGMSTSPVVTEIAGRGIGLDIVREVGERLGGSVSIRTERGRGTTIEVLVPMSRASIDAVLVEVGGAVLAVPLDAVVETVRVADLEITRGANGTSILRDGRVIPFLPLARLLGGRALPAPEPRRWSAVVVRAGADRAAVGIERLVGVAHVIVRGLPPLALADRLVAGAIVDPEGIPILVLDPGEVVRRVALSDPGATPAPPAERLPILVIDDSLTTRMLEKSILESAGHEVHLATSGEDGLEKASARRYALYLVDVEMPGIDGFTFVERTRADPALAGTPAILVTSRDAAEDRRRGAAVGAAAYVVKSELDHRELIRIVDGLVR